MLISRTWAMPSPLTFNIPPIASLLARHIAPGSVVIDPFARESRVGTITNDLDAACGADYNMEAGDFCAHLLLERGQCADVVLFDPPYSPRQISEVYQRIGLKVGTEETQNARLYRRVKNELDKLLRHGGLAICCGWNSAGFGKTRGYEFEEILLVPHGGAHNDTIVTVERKP